MTDQVKEELQQEEKEIADKFTEELLAGMDETYEVNQEKSIKIQENQELVEEKELTDFEKEQQTIGWSPKGPKSAQQWHDEKPLREEISKRGRYVKKLERTIEELKIFMDQQKKHVYDQAIQDLTSKKEAAISLGDSNTVHEIDEQIKKIPAPAQSEHPALSDFRERNKNWFDGSSYEAMKITDFARKRDNQLAAKGLPIEEHLALLEEHIHKEFPDYFNKEVEKPRNYNAVESTSLGSNSIQKIKKVWTMRDLTAEQNKIAEDFDRTGIMKKDDYIKALVEMGELHE